MAEDGETAKIEPPLKLLPSRNFRRVTRWHRLTRIRETETISTRFGPFGPVTASRDLATAPRAKSHKSRYACTKIDKTR